MKYLLCFGLLLGVILNAKAQCNITTDIIFQFNPTACGASDGFAVVNVTSGGTAPFTYTWNTSPAQLDSQLISVPSGMYIVTIADANGCITTDTVLLSDPAPFSITNTTTNQPTCYGGTNGAISVTASTPTATYIWNNNPALNSSLLNNIGSGTYLCSVTDFGCTINTLIQLGSPPEITGTVNIINQVLCKGQSNGSAYASATGGTGALTFTWLPSNIQNDSISGLPQGNYQLVVSDNNACSKTFNFTITEPADSLQTDSLFATNVTCFGLSNGFIKLKTSGGTPPYSYSWTNTLSTADSALNLSAGTYQIFTTDFNGCKDTTSVIITQPLPLSITLLPNNFTICSGSSTVIHSVVTGGTSPYNYLWNTGQFSDSIEVSPLVPTSYTLFVTDVNNCQLNNSVSISIAPSPLVNLINTDTICPGGTLKLIASGASSYSWFPSATLNTNTGNTVIASPTVNTKYYVVASNTFGCSTTDSVLVVIDNSTSAAFTATPNSPQTGDSVLFTNTSVGSQLAYSWNFGDGTPTTKETNPSHIFLFEGEYQVQLSAVNKRGCKDTFALKIAVADQYSFEIPNVFTPNADGKNDAFRFITSKGITKLHCEIYNRYGIREYTFDGPKGQWEGYNQSGEPCPAGVYFYVITLTTHTGENKEFSGNITLIR